MVAIPKKNQIITSSKELSDNIKLLFPEQKKICFKEDGFFISLKKYIKYLYFLFNDRRIHDLSYLRTDLALGYLERFNPKRINSFKVVKTAIRHKNKKVVLKGIEILKHIRTIDSRKVLCTTLTSKDRDIILAGIDALKLFKSQNIVNPLASCLERKDKKIALAALWALAELKTSEAAEAIETLLNHKDEELRKTATWILKGMKNSSKKKIQAKI